jgi:hypothetical protein
MVILRQKMRSKPDKAEEVMEALAAIIVPAPTFLGAIDPWRRTKDVPRRA